MAFFRRGFIGFNKLLVTRGGAGGLPNGDFDLAELTYYPEPIGGSTATQKYITELDGQDDFWLSDSAWTATNVVIEYSLVGSTSANKGINDTLATDASGNLAWTSFTGTVELNGATITTGTTPMVAGEINHIVMTGALSSTITKHGSNAAGTSFYDAAIVSIKLTDTANASNSYTYKLSSNLPYELPIGEELGGELISNGAFGGSIDGWTPRDSGQLSYVNSKLRVERATSQNYPAAQQELTGLTVGQTYYCAVNVDNPLGLEAYVAIVGDTGGAQRTFGSGMLDYFFTATATTHTLTVGLWLSSGAIGEYVDFEYVSFKALPASALTLQNGEPEGSDRILVTRKDDGSGWTDGANDYDYAAGAND